MMKPLPFESDPRSDRPAEAPHPLLILLRDKLENLSQELLREGTVTPAALVELLPLNLQIFLRKHGYRLANYEIGMPLPRIPQWRHLFQAKGYENPQNLIVVYPPVLDENDRVILPGASRQKSVTTR